jgi:hypothetical protein
MAMMITRVLLALLCSVCVASTARAQASADGTIRGIVKDSQGGVLPGVSITATSPSVPNAIVAVSTTDGSYRLLNLPPGEYTIRYVF